MTHGVSLLVPAWNEERRIGATLERYASVLESIGDPFEILVVTDGVTDGTASVARSYAARNVRAHEFPIRLGKGGAVIAGLALTNYDRIGYLDADSPVSASDIRCLIQTLETADAAIGSRRLRGSLFLKNVPFARRVFRVGFNVLTRSVLGLRIRDTQCGAKFFRRSALFPVLKRVRLRGWAFDAAMLFELQSDGRTIVEVPVTWNYDDDSRLPLVQQVPIMMLSVALIRFRGFLRVLRGISPGSCSWFARTFMHLTPERAMIMEGALNEAHLGPPSP